MTDAERIEALEAKIALLNASLNWEYRKRMILCVAVEEIIKIANRAMESCNHD